MRKKFYVSVAVVFVVSMLWGFAVHAWILADEYNALGGMFRSDQEAAGHFPFMLLGHLAFAAGFVWIYLRGRENRPWLGQGLRFGAAVAVMLIVGTYLIYYAVQPYPGILVLRQITYDSIGVLIMGVAVAWINR